jgi:hemerythrin-like domain-containing protein
MDEHRVIEHVLDALERATDHLARGGAVRPAFFLDAADFISGFADGCHHRKEEGVLFGAMQESGAPGRGGPIEMMLDEHEQGRAFTKAIRAAARSLEKGDDSARAPLVANARGYVALLRDHIMKEDELVFPMADDLLTPEQEAQVLRGFARVEHEDAGDGAHAKFHALAHTLAAEAASLGA